MNSSVSMFSQVMSLISRDEFSKAAAELKTERGAKGFTSWEHFVSMMFCQLAQAKSLREISMGLGTCLGKLNHLGMEEAPKRSTLSYANAHRPAKLFETVFNSMLEVCLRSAPGKKTKFRFKNKLFSLDATTIELCLAMFPWAKFRQTKGAVKLHTLLDHDGYLPVFVNVTDGKTHEVKVAWELSLPKGSIVAMDRGYVGYALFHKWTEAGVFFVTRMKDNGVFETIGAGLPVLDGGSVVSDQVIVLTGPQSNLNCPDPLRLVTVRRDDGSEMRLLTNNFELASSTISAIYKDRWEIEIFFKTIKQNLKIKTFVGTTPNALKAQIWTALTAILLLKYLQFKSRLSWSFSNLVALVRWNLFSHRDLWIWLDDPEGLFLKPDEGGMHQPFLDSIFAN